jgi:hypothetical protein
MGKIKQDDEAVKQAKAARASQKLARGHVSPAKAAKVRHGHSVVMGEIDSTYHGCTK